MYLVSPPSLQLRWNEQHACMTTSTIHELARGPNGCPPPTEERMIPHSAHPAALHIRNLQEAGDCLLFLRKISLLVSCVEFSVHLSCSRARRSHNTPRERKRTGLNNIHILSRLVIPSEARPTSPRDPCRHHALQFREVVNSPISLLYPLSSCEIRERPESMKL
jgi:hypothetical protein